MPTTQRGTLRGKLFPFLPQTKWGLNIKARSHEGLREWIGGFSSCVVTRQLLSVSDFMAVVPNPVHLAEVKQ